jgi:hypothetical protein
VRAYDDATAGNGSTDATAATTGTVPIADYGTRPVQESRRISIGNPLQFIVPLVGLALVALGLAAMIRGGFGGGFDERSTTILWFDQTPWLAIAEVAGGLVLFALSWSRIGRMVAALMGAGLVAVGVMVLLGTSSVHSNIGTNDAGGWLAVVLGGLTVVGCATPCALVERRRVASDPVA